MTRPRLITPGATYFVTRRTLRRHHLFAPNDPRIRQLFLYALAVAAARYDLLVHAAVLMSTHEHLVLTDTTGRLPEFLQFFHRIVALGTKVVRGWEGAVWDLGKTSVVELLTPEAVAEKVAYAMANPVAAGLVHRARDWPGVTTRVEELGTGGWRIPRPTFFFDPESGCWPETADLRMTLPRAADAFGEASAFRAAVSSELGRLESQARATVRAKRWSVLGVDRCRRLSPFARARSWEPIGSLDPSFAVGRGRHDARHEAIARVREFRAAYREALGDWRAGQRQVCFPAGTWLMRVVHAANVSETTFAA